ncbi:MAG TPA: M67 family metallopeptidase [Candidatus Eisenbacteria bacterium]|nr:M67 family metallopeptidase [Candidatus Eisenbacteria bacterium]
MSRGPDAEEFPERGPDWQAAGYYPGSDDAAHPGPASVELADPIRSAIVAHAVAGLPNEACGLVIGDRPAGEGGRALRWVPLANPAASPYRYEIEPDDLLRITIELDSTDEVIWAIVHSHVASPARPSPTDVRQSFYPEALYFIVSLRPEEADPVTGAESVRAWRIVDGAVHEVGVAPASRD